LFPKFDSVFKMDRKTAKESGILYRYPIDLDYNKYNFITVILNPVNLTEIAIMSEMVKNMVDILTVSTYE
jgi:hypothetical protein